MKKNCPNCGAPIENEVCPYCGTYFYDFAALDANEPCYIKIKVKDKILTAKVNINSIDMNRYHSDLFGGKGNSLMYTIDQGIDLDISMTVVDNKIKIIESEDK